MIAITTPKRRPPRIAPRGPIRTLDDVASELAKTVGSVGKVGGATTLCVHTYATSFYDDLDAESRAAVDRVMEERILAAREAKIAAETGGRVFEDVADEESGDW